MPAASAARAVKLFVPPRRPVWPDYISGKPRTFFEKSCEFNNMYVVYKYNVHTYIIAIAHLLAI